MYCYPKTGIIANTFLYLLTNRKNPSGAIFGDKLAMGGRGREVEREGREVGDVGAGSGDRGGGKRGSSTPLSTPTMTYPLKNSDAL